MSPFKKFWPREMFKFRNPLDYSITEDSDTAKGREVQSTNPYNNLPSMQNPRMSASFLERRTHNPEFERDYQKTKYYNPPQQQFQGQNNPYMRSNIGMHNTMGNNPYQKQHQDRSPYQSPDLFQQFQSLNPANPRYNHNQYEDPRYNMNGHQLQGLDEYGLLQGQSKDKMVSEDEGWDLNDLPRPINHYRDILPTMQYRPEHEPKRPSESDEVQF